MKKFFVELPDTLYQEALQAAEDEMKTFRELIRDAVRERIKDTRAKHSEFGQIPGPLWSPADFRL